MDAPELSQQGRDANGNPVPVGDQSRLALNDYLNRGPVRLDEPVHYSWNRPVGRVYAPQERWLGLLPPAETDVGLDMVERGDAFAAADYVEDPDYRFSIAQAQRQARRNRLGLHDLEVQPPEDFRENGEDLNFTQQRQRALEEMRANLRPEERVRGHSWFNRSPIEGLNDEERTQWLSVLRDGSSSDIVRTATELGFLTDEDSTRDWVEWRNSEYAEGREVPLNVIIRESPPELLDGGGERQGAMVRGYGSGFTMEGLDEIGAVFDTFGIGGSGQQRENVWNSDRRIADIWANNQRQNAAILGFDKAHHPTQYYGGQIAGALHSGVVLPYSAGLRTGQIARYGAAWGAGEGFLGTDGSVADRMTGAAIGAPIGFVADPAIARGLDAAIPALGRGARAIADRFRGRPSMEAAGSEAAMNSGFDAVDGLDAPNARPAGGEANLPPLPSGATLNPPSAQAMAGDSGEAVAGSVPRPQRMDAPLDNAARQTAAENIQPRDVLPVPSNQVDDVAEAAGIDAGRIVPARAPNERDELQRRTVRNVMGIEVPKVGPIDLVGWLRLRGGLRDQGGELSHMGITSNASRRGLDHVGQEHRFGPLLSEDGMNLDDAAIRAWEEGYFPELAERPTVNEFLDAVRETYDGGTGRRFLPDDFAELDAFNARQGERYDYEQQLHDTGGPIYRDRGQPAGADTPFPPVQAYEEWPSDAIERVGNIDVERLDTPQDIRRALKASHNAMGGFDAATRGRVTQAETERLAGELNMTADQLLARRRGQALNAEEALAARRILAKSSNELVNAARRLRALGDDPGAEALAEFRHMWVRHVAIQEQVAGMTAEAGRALQQFRQAANSREVRGDVLNGLVRAGGGREGLTDAADALIEAAEVSPGVFNAVAERANKPRFRDKVAELYINFLLSNPPTHVVNMVSNTLTSIAQIPEFAAGAAIGGARRAVMGRGAQDRILASEVGARAIGLIQGTKEGARLFARALRTGEADDFVSKVEGDQFRAIGGLTGEVVRVPTRLLTAEDQLFKGVARRMELNAQAVRVARREGLRGQEAVERIAELSANPTDEMLERSLDYGRYLTFQRNLGEFGQSLSRITSTSLPAKIIIPFVRTPINLLKFATERSIAAPLLKEWRADFRAGGERRDLAIARMMLGTGFAAVMYEAALDGQITGAVPPDPARARLLYADGWQPYSVRVGDRWVSYSRLDPFSTTIGVAADMATLPDGLSDRQQDDKATLLVASIMGNLASKTWLSGMSSFVNGLSDPGRYADSWVQRTASSAAVPAGVAGFARAMDPVSRQRNSIGEAIQARIPGMTDSLYPRRDVFGEPVELDSLGPDFISPFWQSQARNDPVIAELLRLGRSVSAPGRQRMVDGERVDYTPEEYDRYHEIAGRLTYNNLLAQVSSPQWERMSAEDQSDAVTDAVREARATARGVLDDMSFALPARGAPMLQQEGLPQLPAGARLNDLPPLPDGARLN